MKDPVYSSYRVARWFYEHHFALLAYIVRGFMRVIFACDIPYKATIGEGTLFPHHALGVVIHPDAIIGKECTVRQNVTIGGRNEISVLPVIEDQVSIGCGAAILGPVRIGRGAQIGAGAVVVKDVPSGATAIGVPAKILHGEGVDR